jgi:AraC-like DNA-binding protein
MSTNIEYKDPTSSFRFSNKIAVGHYNMVRYHLHDSYEVYYLLSGERYYFIKDRTFQVKKGDLVLISPNILHKTSDTGIPNHHRMVCFFDVDLLPLRNPEFSSRLGDLFENHPLIRLSIPGQTQLEELLRQIYQEIEENQHGTEVLLQSLLLKFLIFTLRYVEQNQLHIFEHPSPTHQKISEIVQYINERYPEPLPLTSVAEHFFISPYYLSRTFKEATGFTFIEYINSVRIKEAQKLLRESRLKVIHIAERVGFGSIAHFGRVFKSITGRSPLYYRKLG